LVTNARLSQLSAGDQPKLVNTKACDQIPDIHRTTMPYRCQSWKRAVFEPL